MLMGDMSCPQCGYAQLDVDAQNSVVYCRNCGFAVRVDPQTGETTPISQGGGAPAGGSMPAQAGGGGYGGSRGILGLDSTTALLGGTLVILIAAWLLNMLDEPLIPITAWVLFFIYWLKAK